MSIKLLCCHFSSSFSVHIYIYLFLSFSLPLSSSHSLSLSFLACIVQTLAPLATISPLLFSLTLPMSKPPTAPLTSSAFHWSKRAYSLDSKCKQANWKYFREFRLLVSNDHSKRTTANKLKLKGWDACWSRQTITNIWTRSTSTEKQLKCIFGGGRRANIFNEYCSFFSGLLKPNNKVHVDKREKTNDCQISNKLRYHWHSCTISMLLLFVNSRLKQNSRSYHS